MELEVRSGGEVLVCRGGMVEWYRGDVRQEARIEEVQPGGVVIVEEVGWRGWLGRCRVRLAMRAGDADEWEAGPFGRRAAQAWVGEFGRLVEYADRQRRRTWAVMHGRAVADAVEALQREVNGVMGTERWIQRGRWKDLQAVYAERLEGAEEALLQLRSGGDEQEQALVAKVRRAAWWRRAGLRGDGYRQKLNREWSGLEAAAARAFFERRVPRVADLTDEQCRAVVQWAPANLVVAGAGSGKTKMLAGRCAWLLGRKGVPPEEILVLCFANGPVAEMQTRLKAVLGEDLGGRIRVQTFHSLGKEIVEKVSTRAFGFHREVTDEAVGLREVVHDLLAGACAQDPSFAETVLVALALVRDGSREPVTAAAFERRVQWERALRTVDLQALDGNRVGTWEDRQIADTLLGLGVEFAVVRDRPEWPGAVFLVGPVVADVVDGRDADEDWGQLAASPGVLCVWAAPTVDGERCVKWAGFEQIRKERRARCADVIEVATREVVDGDRLRQRLRTGVETRRWRVETDAVFRSEGRGRAGSAVGRLVGTLESFICLSKAALLPESVIESRMAADGQGRRFWPVAREIMGRYEHMLAAGVPAGDVTSSEPFAGERRQGDYPDLLRFAAQLVDRFPAGQWKHVLCDEYQDTMPGAAAVLAAMRRQGAKLCCVGDDWQSIYGFSGADVQVVQRFLAEYGGDGSEVVLTKSFRCRGDVVGVAGDFIMANPGQKRKEIVAARPEGGGGGVVLLLPGRRLAPEDRDAYFDDALRLCPEEAKSVLVLALYRNTLARWGIDEKPRQGDGGARVEEMRERFGDGWSAGTMHAAKGAEADFVVLMDVVRGRWGFPSEKREEAVVELLRREAESFPYASERRLMYVGLTRTRNGVVVLESFICLSKAALLPESVIESRMAADGQGRRFWPVAREIMGRYEHMLAAGVPAGDVTSSEPFAGERRQGDYPDLLRFAAQLVDRFPAGQWKHVLCDEYQDTMPGAAAVLAAMRRQGAKLCCVGDDWQSIYGFSGADVQVVQRFLAEYGGDGSEVVLTKSFRCRGDVVGVAGDFIMANPGQKRKEIVAARPEGGGGGVVLLLPGRRLAPEDRDAYFDDALRLCPEEAKSVLVLALYRNTLARWGIDEKPRQGDGGARVEEMRERFGDGWSAGTMHAAKGAEADFVVLMDVVRGRWGFPSEKREEAVVELLRREAESFPYASERRLMYVGLTRTRNGVVVLASAGPSSFVAELALDPRVRLQCWGDPDRNVDGVCSKCSKPLVRAYGLALRWCPKCQRREREDAETLALELGAAGARFRRG